MTKAGTAALVLYGVGAACAHPPAPVPPAHEVPDAEVSPSTTASPRPPPEPVPPFSSPATVGEWLPLPALEPGLGYPAIADGSMLHVLNVPVPDGTGTHFRSARLDLQRRAWLPPTPMPPLRFGGSPLLSYVRGGDRLFLVGGKDGYHSPDFPIAASQDLRTGEWRQLPSEAAPTRRDDHVLVFAAGKLVVWGGSRTTFWKGSSTPEFLGDGAIYDPDANRWTPIAREGAPDARIADAVAFSDRVFVWRGVKGPGKCLWSGSSACEPAKDAALLNVPGNRWEPVPPEGAPRTGTPVGATGDRVVVVDRWEATGGIFDLATGSWTPLAPLASPRRFSESQGWLQPRWLSGRMVLVGTCGSEPGRSRPVAVLDARKNEWRELSLPPAACAAEPVVGRERLLLVDRVQLGSAQAPHLLWEIDPVEVRAQVASVPRNEAVRGHGSLHWTQEGLVVLGGIVDGPNGCEGGPVPPPLGPGTCDPMPPEHRTDGSLIRPSFVPLSWP